MEEWARERERRGKYKYGNKESMDSGNRERDKQRGREIAIELEGREIVTELEGRKSVCM